MGDIPNYTNGQPTVQISEKKNLTAAPGAPSGSIDPV